MKQSCFFHKVILCLAIIAFLIMFTNFSALSQLPISYYYTQPLLYPAYPYLNTIDPYLLGYTTPSIFLDPATTALYDAAGFTTYPYPYQFLNQYTTVIPYATLDPLSPYALPAYPTYLYGDPSWYATWVDLNW